MQKLKNILTHPLVSGSTVLVGGSMAGNIINYLYHFLMGRSLGVVNYGVLVSLYSILYIVATVPNASSIAIVKFVSSAKDKKELGVIYNSINKLITKIAIILALLMLVVSPFVANFLRIDDLKNVLIVAPILFLSLVTLVNQSTLQGILSFSGVVGPNIAMSIVKLTVGLLLIALGFSVFGAMGGVLIGALVAYFLSIKLKGTKIQKSNQTTSLKLFYKYSFHAIIQAIAYTSFFTTDVILVKHFLSPLDAGAYAALSTLGKIIIFAAQPVTQAMFPIIAKKKSKEERYLEVLLISLGITAALAFGAVVVYALIPDFIISTLYKDQAFLTASSDLVWMAIFMAMYSLCYFLTNFFLSINKSAVVYLSLAFAIFQALGIFFFHNSIREVILVSIFFTGFLFVLQSSYLAFHMLYKKQ